MATTSVSTDRLPYNAIENYPDASFVTDDKKFYFGTGGDVSMYYDATVSDMLILTGDSNIVKGRGPGFIAVEQSTLAIPVTHNLVMKDLSDVDTALTLVDGDPGQLLSVVISDAGGNKGTITPTTVYGFATVVLSDSGDRVSFLYLNDTQGWTVLGATGGTFVSITM